MTATLQLRYPEYFLGSDGSTSYTFPLKQLEYDPQQAYVQALEQLAGADYPFDAYGTSPWPKAHGIETIRFMVANDTPANLDTEIDNLISKLRRGGLGKLYTTDAAAVYRWSYCKLMQRPSSLRKTEMSGYTVVSLQFVRESDWYAASATTATIALAATPQAFTLTNPGNGRVRDITFRLRSNNGTGFTHPSIVNGTLALTISSARNAASANSELKITTLHGGGLVQYSNDDGVSYTDDYANVTLPSGQVPLMELDAGVNSMSYTDGGTPNSSLEVSFFAVWE